MKNFILVSFYLLATKFSVAQNAASFYKTGDSLFKIKDYKNAAVVYSAGIREEGKTATMNRYWVLASRWTLAGETDSAFQSLNEVAVSDKTNRVLARSIENDLDLTPLKNDKRWKPLLLKIQQRAEANGYVQEEFVYGRKDGMGLTLVCIKPRPTGSSGQAKIKANGKAIISLQSGNWFSSYNGIEINTTTTEQYLKKGYTVFTVMHGSQPRYAIPDAVSDIKRAVRYIRYHAAKFNIDPDHIGITGISSGGHLTLLVATADDKINTTAADPVDRVSSRVQAAAVLFPPTDLLNWGGTGFNFVNAKQILTANKIWGAIEFRVYNDKLNLYEEITDTTARSKIGKEISPINFVTADDPPVFILHGDADPTVPLQQSQSIIAKFNEASVPNRFVIKKGGKHNPFDMNPEWQEFVDWFDKYLK